MRSLVINILLSGLIIISCKSVYVTSYNIYPGDDLANTITNNTCSWDIVYIREGVHYLSADVNIPGKSLPLVRDASGRTIIVIDGYFFRFFKT